MNEHVHTITFYSVNNKAYLGSASEDIPFLCKWVLVCGVTKGPTD
jgi:hypothetical protein